MSKLNALVTEFTEMKKTFTDKAKVAFQEATKELFEKVPDLVAVKWHQYTPYFNDGDACVFRVGDVGFKLTSTDDEAGDYEDGFESVWGLNYELEKRTGKKGAKHPLSAQLEEFSDLIGSDAMEDILLDMFDDHKEITLTREGIEVDDYDHD